jgi:site-specific DNA recombinase
MNMQERSTQAVTYLRVSSAGQVDGDGFPRQRETCSTYAATHGIEIVGEFRDEACSGCTDADAREGFGAMIERISGNGVTVVLVERADRLARDLIVSETLLATVRKLGVRVIEACSGIDLTDASDPSRILIRQVLGAVAEFQKRELVGKLAKARKRIRETSGRCEGRKPYGFAEGESFGLSRLLELVYQRDVTYREAADILNAEGIRTRNGRPWLPGTVHAVANRAASRILGEFPRNLMITAIEREAAAAEVHDDAKA